MGASLSIRVDRIARSVSRLAAIAILSAGSPALATSYSETDKGDLSGNPKSPTDIGALTLGDNSIFGATIPTGAVIDPVTGQRAVEDDDYLTFTVPTGSVLSQLVLGRSSVFQGTDRMFFGIARGTQVTVDPSFTSAAGLLGWTLVGGAMVGTDVLPELGKAAPAMFPPIGGATRFTGALGAGTYTLWIVDGDQTAVYSLDLVTSAVPEAASWATMLLGVGLAGAALRRSGRRHPRAAIA